MSRETCESFLAIASQFQLGDLDTEKPHPLSLNLSTLAKSNLPVAIDCLVQIDIEALKQLEGKAEQIARLGNDIHDTLNSDGRIFLCGCGATGRLSISLEVFCRSGLVEKSFEDRVIGFMAGGDAALIKSIERFEDIPQYGKDQLLELGFTSNDLLISSTEGGETPFVIGATEAATLHSNRTPWFLYCNPDAVLVKNAERSRKVIENKRIHKLNLSVGPMGLSGSTRMQSSTVIMAAIGWAIEYGNDAEAILTRILILKKYLQSNNISCIARFIEKESNEYLNGRYISYRSQSCAVTVLTDTTERAPTFSLAPFENRFSIHDTPGWCYLIQEHVNDSKAAWLDLLKREPRCLEWEGISKFTGKNYLYGFTIGRNGKNLREIKTGSDAHSCFIIEEHNDELIWQFKDLKETFKLRGLSLLEKNLVLKMLLNIHSTLIMGVLERYEGNLMTFVRPSNNKLIDRAIRYIRLLCKKRGLPIPDYVKTAHLVFTYKDSLKAGNAIVLKVLEEIKKSAHRGKYPNFECK